jgi:hypothetical protein
VAVVSQPGQRSARIKAPGPIDTKRKEFWAENPWDIVKEGHNLSAYERKRTWINLGGKGFLDVSYLTRADSDGDGRSVIGCDFRNNGQLDLVVRQIGGGSLLLFENHFPSRHYLEVSLRGTRSNRLGIGARIKAEVGGRQIVREVFPCNTYGSQAPCRAHLGLADDTKIDRLTIRWPSGAEQVLRDLAGDRHIVVEEGKEGADAVETVVPGQTIRP